jgi:hypothetical protein
MVISKYLSGAIMYSNKPMGRMSVETADRDGKWQFFPQNFEMNIPPE